MGRLLALLPQEMRKRVSEHPELLDLVEVVMDLGRKPLARFPSGDFVLSDCPITLQDLQHATSQTSPVYKAELQAVNNRFLRLVTLLLTIEQASAKHCIALVP